MAEVAAVRAVAAAPAAVFAFLSDLGNHWDLAGGAIEVVSLERAPDGRAVGGRVRLRGPLGLRRTATTRVEHERPPGAIAGTATVGRRTRARVGWAIDASKGGATVRLSAHVERAAPLDRLLLALGGRAWLARRFDLILDRLAERLEGAQWSATYPPSGAMGRPASSQRVRPPARL